MGRGRLSGRGHDAGAAILAGSALADPEALLLRPAEFVADFGTTLVVAPHPDDESLGCGGAIALLRRRGCRVHVLFVTDGAASHLHSRRYPPDELRALREREACSALSALGVARKHVAFLRLPDGAMPSPGSAEFDRAVDRIRGLLAEIAPQTLLLPWRRDPHPDHRAAVRLVRAALAEAPAGGQTSAATTHADVSPPEPYACTSVPRVPSQPDAGIPVPQGSSVPRVVEYPIWLWHRGDPGDAPGKREARAWRLDISHVLDQKRNAIAAHRSQTTDLIDDDPTAFRLTPELLAPFLLPWEVYLEAR